MNIKENIFLEISCLTEESPAISGLFLAKKWFKKADKRYLAEHLQKFNDYNKEFFDFLQVSPKIEGSGKDVSLSFKSDRFIGAIPLRSPDTGKQIGDFVVKPRYTSTEDQFSGYVEIVNLLEAEILPEFKHSIPLLSQNNMKPPLYLEAIKFVNLLEKAVKTKWNKFQTTKRIYRYPKSQVNWKEYVEKEFDPTERLLFPCHDNTLNKFHREFFELKYVYGIAKKEIISFNTPLSIKYQYRDSLTHLDNMLYEFPEKLTNELKVHFSDPVIIKYLKAQGNKILKRNFEEITAWRIDFSLLFEKYVQFVFTQVSLEIGANQLNNYKIRRVSYDSPPWSLNYLEPDIILMKSNMDIVVDVKYKSHLFNLQSITEELKEEHRKDVHQLLAYTTFTRNKNKIAILCYPYIKEYITCIRQVDIN
jgi:Holliday junction resolvase-like predicted endonuclease